MLRNRLALPLIGSSMAVAVVVVTWLAFRQDYEDKTAAVAAAVSYASRSNLARQLDVQFSAFTNVAEFWSRFEGVPTDQWQADATIELTHFDGVDVIAWSSADGPRFLTTGSKLVFDHQPTDEEWDGIQDALSEAEQTDMETVSGPYVDNDGHNVFHYHLPVQRDGRRGVLISIIDSHDLLETLLRDDAPNYDVDVSCCDGAELYSRDSQADSVPDAWIVGGWIEPVQGILWHVEHRPSAALMSELKPWATHAILGVGSVMSLLLGSLIYERRRANDRSTAAAAASEAALAAEKQVREMNRDLEARVAERTRDLNEVVADLDTINLSVSHDLRSPLNVIHLIVYQLQHSNLDAATAKHLETIAANIPRMAGIMDRLLDFSRASSFEYKIERIEMSTLVAKIANELATEGATIEVHDLPAVDADETMVHILVTNLLSNALKYGAVDGRVRISIGCLEHGGVPTFFVKDDGPGFDAEFAQKLFKPMKRQDGGSGEGLGLGLSIVERVVRRHGGMIYAESRPQQGATFFFTLSAGKPQNPGTE